MDFKMKLLEKNKIVEEKRNIDGNNIFLIALAEKRHFTNSWMKMITSIASFQEYRIVFNYK